MDVSEFSDKFPGRLGAAIAFAITACLIRLAWSYFDKKDRDDPQKPQEGTDR